GDDGQDPLENFEYRPYEQDNPLAIDPDIVRGIEREWGYSLLWVMFECAGKPFPERVNARKRNGYAEVHRGNFSGALDQMGEKAGHITREGWVRRARPMQIHARAEGKNNRPPKTPANKIKPGPAIEVVDVPRRGGGKLPSARAKTRHQQSFEPFKIPGDH